MVGYSPGGGYDAYARLLARHMGKYIPGNPTFVVQNRPGASSLIAGNHIYSVAKPDGLTFGTVVRELYTRQLAKEPEVKCDWAKFSWIGSATSEVYVVMARAAKGVRNVEDIKKLPQPLFWGETVMGVGPTLLARAMEDTLGLEFKFVLGYGSSADYAMAMERGEIDIMGGSWGTLIAQRPHWLKEPRLVNIIMQGGIKRSPHLTDVPALGELVTSEKDKRLVLLIDAGNQTARPFIGPPGIPQDQLNLLRRAFDSALKDPALLSDAKKSKLAIDDPLTGEDCAKLAKEIVNVSPDDVTAYQKLLTQKK